MSEPTFKYGSCLIYRTPFWVALPSDSEVALLLKPLSHNIVESLKELQYVHSKDTTYFNYLTNRTVLLNAVIDSKNAMNFPSLEALVNQLSNEDIRFLYEKLTTISMMTQDQIESLGMILQIQFDPQFREDSWNCESCQKKKLDYSRACGFLPEDKRDPAAMLPRIDGKRFTQCPISMIDGYAASQASLSHTLFTSGVLPEAGGLGEQTEWFVRAALTYKRKLAEAESAMMDTHKKK